jgi:hypothetical protein
MLWEEDTWRHRFYFRETYLTLSSTIYFIFFQGFLSTIFCIYVDLYLCMKNPFYPRSSRLTRYKIFIVLSCVAEFSIERLKKAGYDDFDLYKILGYEMVVISISILFFILATIHKLKSHGTSKKLRDSVRQKYLCYFFLLVPYFTKHIFGLLNLMNIVSWPYFIWTRVISDALMILQFIYRFSEPYIWSQIVPDSTKKYSSQPLTTFINSAINIEYVYLILHGTDILYAKGYSKTRKRTKFQIEGALIDTDHNWSISRQSQILRDTSISASKTPGVVEINHKRKRSPRFSRR